MRRALVTGATGFVGSHLVDALLSQGYAVSSTVRPTSDTRWIKGTGAQLLPCDLSSVESVSKALFNVGTVFHVAGAIASPSAAEFLAINEQLTRSVLEACARQSEPSRFVYVSSLAAAGPGTLERPRSEEMAPEPVSDYGRSKLAGENAVQEYSGRLPWVIARPPVVYGPRDRATLALFRLARSPIRPTPGRARGLSLIYVEDLVRGLIAGAESHDSTGETYFLTHPEPETMGGLAARLAALTAKRGIDVSVPDPVIKGAAAVSELVGRALRRQPALSRDKAREMTQAGWVCSGAKAQAELGFVASTPHEQGLLTTYQWYRDAGWL